MAVAAVVAVVTTARASVLLAAVVAVASSTGAVCGLVRVATLAVLAGIVVHGSGKESKES